MIVNTVVMSVIYSVTNKPIMLSVIMLNVVMLSVVALVKQVSPQPHKYGYKVRTKWKGINRKQSTRWQHLSRLKLVHSFLCKFFLVVMKHSNLYLGLVLPSGG